MCLYLSVWDSVCFCVEVNKGSVMVVNKMVDMVVDEVADMYHMINVCIIPTYFNIWHILRIIKLNQPISPVLLLDDGQDGGSKGGC